MAEGDVLRLDAVIVGGGIAGLWLLARLRKAGYSALLLESQALGEGQSIAAQGIIHGGLKYALDLSLSGESEILADLPARWRACLQGNGEIDLRAAPVRAENHLFWVRKSLASRMAGFFGARMLRGRVDALEEADWPAVLRDRDAVGAVYRLDEIVLDVPGLLAALAKPHAAAVKRIAADWRVAPGEDGLDLLVRDPAGRAVRVAASSLIFTAGAGNAAALAALGLPAATAQRRPLHMLLVRDAPAPLWAHCFDASDKPRVTVTTHQAADGALVWYVGGLLAERGVAQSEIELIAAGKAELAVLLPRADLSRCRFAGWRVDRAEGAMPDGRKPEGPVLQRAGKAWIAWPTKLALAPKLADALLAQLPPPARSFDLAVLADWPAAAVAAPVWERATWK